MRAMNDNGRILCKIQGKLFANYSSFSKCSPYVFIRRFMHSDLAKRFDDTTILLEASNNNTFVNEIIEQYGETNYGDPDSVDKEVLYWLGYVYRYWAFVYEVPSFILIQHVKPKSLVDRYPLYHSMDMEYLIERISEEEQVMIAPKKSLEELLSEYLENHSN